MHILILGGAGMVGRKLAERLAKDGTLGGKAITGLTLQVLKFMGREMSTTPGNAKRE